MATLKLQRESRNVKSSDKSRLQKVIPEKERICKLKDPLSKYGAEKFA